MRQRGFVLLPVIIIALIGILGYFVYQNTKLQNVGVNSTSPSSVPNTNFPKPSTTSDPTANWKTYEDTINKFSIKYPNGWSVSKQGGAFPWINIDSPDIAPKGSQDTSIGMSVGIQVFNMLQTITDNDLRQLVVDEGILKHFKVNIVTEGYLSIQNHKMFKYEYNGIEPNYLFHFWGMNITNNQTIISVQITDTKQDKSLNTTELANQILSSFKFEQ